MKVAYLAALVAVIAASTIARAVPPSEAQRPENGRPALSGSLSLSEAVQLGLQNNLTLFAAHADVLAAHAETGAARAMTLPQISANSYATVGSMSSILGGASGVTPLNLLAVPRRPFADQNVMLMAPIYTGGRLGNMVRTASSRERAVGATAAATENDVALTIKVTFYRALLAGELVKVARARADENSGLAANARALFDAGKGIKAQVSRAEAGLADAQRMLTTASNEQAKALLDLKRVMGVRLDSNIVLTDSNSPAPPLGDVTERIKEAALFRPELVAARARVAAAEAQASAVRGSAGPQVYGTAMLDGYSSTSMGGAGGYTAGLTVSIPLVDAGQRRAEFARSNAVRRRAEAELADTELMVETEVRQAWLDIDTAEQNLVTARSALVAAQEAYNLIALRVQNDKSIEVEALDAISALTQARSNVVQAIYDQSVAIARLHRAVGRTE